MSRRIVLFLVASTFAVAAHAGNLIQNPDFDDGLTGWTQSFGSGTITVDDTAGNPPPSAHLVADPTVGGIYLDSACMAFDNSSNIDMRFIAGGGPGQANVAIKVFSDAACADALDTMQTGGITLGPYREYDTHNFALPAGTMSVKVSLGVLIYQIGATPDAHFDHIGFGPTGTLDTSVDIQQGLSGAWYNPETSGQGLEFIVSPDATTPTDSSVFGAWYTYDTTAGGSDAQRWYSFQSTTIDAGAAIAPVTIYQNVGGNFDAPPTTPSTAIGMGTLRFDTCTSGSFDFELDDGRTGTIPLRRLLPNSTCVDDSAPTNPPSDFGLSGSWYNSDTSGQGLMVDVDPTDGQVFVGWFTYALDGQAQGASGQRWFSAQGGYLVGSNTMALTLYASSGGTFDSDATPVTTEEVGIAVLTYTSCTAATFDYAFTSGELNGQAGTLTLTRLGPQLTSCDLQDPNTSH